MTLKVLENYTWGLLWESVNFPDQNLSDEQKLIKAFLCGYWWQNEDLSLITLNTIDNKTCEYYWVKTMIALANAKSQEFLNNLEISKKLNIPQNFVDWAMIEYYGRTSSFEIQAKLFIESVSKSDTWPYIAFMQSTKFDSFDPKYLINIFNLDNITINSTLEQILFKLKILDDLELYDLIESFIFDILNKKSDMLVVSMLSFSLYTNNIKTGSFIDNLNLLDITRKVNFMDFNLIIEWLLLSISHYSSDVNIKEKINYALKTVPDQLEYKGAIVSFALIYYWQREDMFNIEKITNIFSAYLNTEPKYFPWIKSFFIFINLLYNYRVNKTTIYNLEENIQYEDLFILGESHCLTLSNLPMLIAEKIYKAKSCFIMGLKMYHLKQETSNKYKNSFLMHLNNLKENSCILLTIGEIDCRPDEGIWNSYKKTNQSLDYLIEKTVVEYIKFIENCLNDKSFKSIIIQGIAAPNYNLAEYRKFIACGEEKNFLKMIKDVNVILKRETISKKWKFLDIYNATTNKDGKSNGKHHLDGMHLKPSFYKNIDSFIV